MSPEKRTKNTLAVLLKNCEVFEKFNQKRPIGFSNEKKKSTDSISILSKKIDIIIAEPVYELPDGFDQIESCATKKETIDFFMPLAKEKNNFFNKHYMEEKDVLEFLKKNFAIFNCTPTGKYFPINLTKAQKGRLRCFVTEFYMAYGSKTVNETKKYALLLKHNFEIFKDDKLQSLNNNMQFKKCSTGKNRIPNPYNKIKTQL